MKIKSVAVVHLVWLPLGIDFFKKFISSYQEFEPGYKHDLIIVFNGVNADSDTNEYHALLKQYGISYSAYNFKEGQDIKAYEWIANQLEHMYVLFLNSYVQILANNWLHSFMKPVDDNNFGAVAATGSWQSHYSSVFVRHPFKWENEKSFFENFRKYKLFIKAFVYWQWLFPPFPNPHVRTSSFLMERTVFLTLCRKEIKDKFEAYRFESGWKGLTKTLLKKGKKVFVVDKFGKLYDKENWKMSATFWIENQQNLLMSDKQTQFFQTSTVEQRKVLTSQAWGRHE